MTDDRGFDEAQTCTRCGRLVMHNAAGEAQPHYRPTRGHVRCVELPKLEEWPDGMVG